jgi:hypothetical protein
MPEAGAQHPEKRRGVQTIFLKTKRAAFPLCQRQRCKGAFLQKESENKTKQTFLKTYDLHLCTLLFLQCENVKKKRKSEEIRSKQILPFQTIQNRGRLPPPTISKSKVQHHPHAYTKHTKTQKESSHPNMFANTAWIFDSGKQRIFLRKHGRKYQIFSFR